MYTVILNALRDIISRKEKEGPVIRCSSLFYLINSLYLCNELDKNFKNYLDTRDSSLECEILVNSNMSSLFIGKALCNNDLSRSFEFILKVLHEMTAPVQDSLVDFEKYTPTLEEIKTPNDFIIKNLEKICEELSELKYPITHENNERCFKIVAWWNDKVQSKMAA